MGDGEAVLVDGGCSAGGGGAVLVDGDCWRRWGEEAVTHVEAADGARGSGRRC
jgi:hypothetical protein